MTNASDGKPHANGDSHLEVCCTVPLTAASRRDPPYLCELLGMVIRHWLPFALFAFVWLVFAGLIGHAFGLPHLFRDDPQLFQDGMGAWLNSPTMWGSAAAILLLITILTGVFVNKRLHQEGPRTTWRELSWHVLSRGWLFGLLLLVAVVVRSYRATGLSEPMSLIVDLAEALLGILIGVGLASVSTFLMSELYVRAYNRLAHTWLGRRATVYLQWISVQRLSDNHSPDAAWVALYFFAGVLLVTLPFMIFNIIVPAVALCILLVWFILAYFFLGALRPLVRHPVIVLVLVFYAVFGYDAFRNRFPGFAVVADNEKIDLYDCPRQLYDGQHVCKELRKPEPEAAKAATLQADAGESEKQNTAGDVVVRIRTLDPRTRKLIDAWRTAGPAARLSLQQQDDPTKRKLVVVTTSGGAYRAAFWTALVLDELVRRSAPEQRLKGFADQIRLLTGASGGMVASAYFTALSSLDGWSREGAPDIQDHLIMDIKNARDRNNENSVGRFKTYYPIERDSLGPIAQQALQRDAVRSILSPILPESWTHWRRWGDRGLALEEQWATLDLSFEDIEQGVEEGWRPWLIISPMIADTGQPILISNVPVEPVLERIEGAAVDLFDWFPTQRGLLKVSTAVRMNASFPYISPAVSLPTVPKRRIVDAGYYDNYGVNAALAWLSQDGLTKYLRDNVAGIVVVQVRAYSTTSSLQEPDEERPDFPLLPEWLTGPLTGVLSARSSSMLYRNNEQLKLFGAQFCDGFVQTVALENRAKDEDIGMSWYLRPEEVKVMQTELTQDWNRQAFEQLETIWASGHPCDRGRGHRPTSLSPSAPARVVPASASER